MAVQITRQVIEISTTRLVDHPTTISLSSGFALLHAGVHVAAKKREQGRGREALFHGDFFFGSDAGSELPPLPYPK